MTIKSLLLGGLLAVGATLTQAEPVLLDQVIAVVDDDVIMASELQQRVELVYQQNRGGTLPPQAALESQVLERMIIESIQLQMAERGGVRISDAQLNEAMGRIASQNNMSLPQFRQAMEAEGISFALARQQILDEMRISRVQRFQVGERIQITDQDVDYFLASELGKMASSAEYQLGHILIATPDNATPADLKAAEKKASEIVRKLRNGGDFRQLAMAESSSRTALEGGDLGWRKESQLPGLFADVAPKLQVGEISDPISASGGFHIIQLKDKRGGSTQLITQTKTRHILLRPNELRDAEDAERQIHQLYQRLQAGEDFATLAREFSDDPGSGSNGGDLGWVNPGDMVPEFDATMKDTAAGAISAPFETQFGWHILLVEQRRQTDVGAENQRNQVRNMLYGRRFEEELPIWLRKIRSEAYVEIKDRS
ncbi:molecular chaperone SurA [Venatoribacter cucullus]|uniref:Chaperone SurA n=1 Tax=Venatoribacter cucullus TaxID=2661630 RepID=A0A9X7UZI1_9GAMM|nr:peptidylprolyl isomerase [Venatoribacter cucullus]QQD22249.1 molecular chaperone SurA [Oceanospirillaceae bacterium ASx5O]QQD24921.1 molecular chaperone SurA [Venatoribacter cucullus]